MNLKALPISQNLLQMMQKQVLRHHLSVTSTKFIKNAQSLKNLKIGGKYLVIELLGQGSFGSIYKAINLQNSSYVAIKQLFIYKMRQIQNPDERQLKISHIKRQDEILSKLNHPNILKYYQTFENEDFKLIVTQYCNQGTLADLILKHRSLSLQHAINVLKQLCMGVVAMGQVAHRDLKPENIFIHNGRYIIGDFGLSKVIHQNLNSINTYCGTDYTQAPEVKSGKYYKNVDIYSLGVILYIMLCPQGTIQQRGKRVKQMSPDKISLKLKSGNQIPGQVKLFLKQALERQPKKRLQLNRLRQHPIFHMHNSDTIPNMYCININIQDIKDSQIKLSKNITILDQTHLRTWSPIKSIVSQSNNYLYSYKTSSILQQDQQKQQITIEKCKTQQVVQILKEKHQKQEDTQTKIYSKLKQFHLYSKMAQFIYTRIIRIIESKNLIDLKLISNVQLMYMLSARCFMYMSRIYDKSEKLRSEIKFEQQTQHFIQRVSEFYKKCQKKFNQYCKMLKQKQDNVFNMMNTFFTKITSKEKYQKENQLLNGIQNIDYNQPQHVKWIQDKLNLIKKLNTKDEKLQQNVLDTFKIFTKVNQITLGKLKQKDFDTLVEEYFYS